MREKTAVLVITVLLTAALIGCPNSGRRSGKIVPKPSIELRIVPPDAVIIIDGLLVGNAFDFETLEIESGLHTIEVRKHGYEPFRGTFNAGVTPVLEIELKKIE